MIIVHVVSTFSQIYDQALRSQLKKTGSALSLLRKARKEEVNTVATAVNLQPKVLQQIENGEHDCQVKTIFALCDYYNVDIESVVGKGELINLNYGQLRND